jgi:hypothetical protein
MQDFDEHKEILDGTLFHNDVCYLKNFTELLLTLKM